MAQKDVGNKVPIYKLKETKEVMDFYDEWGLDNKYDKDMVEWNYTGPKETVEVFNKHQKEKDINKLKILLANEATKILHGEQASKQAEQTAKETFE